MGSSLVKSVDSTLVHISDFLDLLATIVNQCLQIPLKRIKNVM